MVSSPIIDAGQAPKSVRRLASADRGDTIAIAACRLSEAKPASLSDALRIIDKDPYAAKLKDGYNKKKSFWPSSSSGRSDAARC